MKFMTKIHNNKSETALDTYSALYPFTFSGDIRSLFV